MALTVSLHVPQVERISRNLGILVGKVSFDSSYPTGGESCSGISRYFKSILNITFTGKDGYIFEYDKTNDKVKVMYPQGGESTAQTDGSAVIDSGATSVTSTAANGAIVTVYAGKAREVANATDLSTLTDVEFTAVGLV